MSEESPKSERSRIRPDEINAFVKRNILTILAGIIAVLVVYITALPDGRLLDPLSTKNVVRMLLVGIFFILLIFGRHDKYQLFRVANSVLVPVTVVMILIYIWLDAWGADELSREDRVIENFSYLFPLVGTACLGIVAILLLRKREILTALVSLLGAGVFFVIAMEEVSWFQRVLDVETSEFFLNLE